MVKPLRSVHHRTIIIKTPKDSWTWETIKIFNTIVICKARTMVPNKTIMAVSKLNLTEISWSNSKWICTKLSRITVNKNMERPRHCPLEAMGTLDNSTQAVAEAVKDKITLDKIWVLWVQKETTEAVSIPFFNYLFDKTLISICGLLITN